VVAEIAPCKEVPAIREKPDFAQWNPERLAVVFENRWLLGVIFAIRPLRHVLATAGENGVVGRSIEGQDRVVETGIPSPQGNKVIPDARNESAGCVFKGFRVAKPLQDDKEDVLGGSESSLPCSADQRKGCEPQH
jgi:hypothetical protein